MSNQQLFIPDKIRVGFQNREGTYTGKLAYVIYFDDKGVLRKEKSWLKWCDDKIKFIDYDNTPFDGFVLNKDVGGYKSDWHYRAAHIRVYDPRDFEFEIDLPNLLFILKECDCNKGKGLEGKFVYAWDGTELVLLPVGCQDYKNSKNFTELQSKGVLSKDLIPGASYTTKKQETLTYLGRFNYHYVTGNYSGPKTAHVQKMYTYWNDRICEYSKKPVGFTFYKDMKNIATINSDSVASNFAELVDKYHKSAHGSKIVKLFMKEVKEKHEDVHRSEEWCYEESPGVFVECVSMFNYTDKKLQYIARSSNHSILNGKYTETPYAGKAIAPGMEADYRSRQTHHYSYYGQDREILFDWVEPTNNRLFAELESGAKFRIEYNTFPRP